MRMLLAEDDEKLAESLKRQFSREGFAVDLAFNGIDAEFMGKEEPYDVIILDLGLPERPGLEVLRHWRQQGNDVPVLILTARDAWYERVEGFKNGANDYLGKPFHIEELIARVHALIRRHRSVPGLPLEVGGILLDEERQQARLADGTWVELTGTEFRLLRYFMLYPDRPLSKTRLVEHIYGQDFDRDSNLIEVYVSRLRDKIGKKRIITRRGQGYLFLSSEP